MCAILGCVSPKEERALRFVRKGLLRLSYRGYDSHGWAFSLGEGWGVHKGLGKAPEEGKEEFVPPAMTAVGHLRWATHGKPTLANAHPVETRRYLVVHNGIVTNTSALWEAMYGKETADEAAGPLNLAGDTRCFAEYLEKTSPDGLSLARFDDATRMATGNNAFMVVDKADGTVYLSTCGGLPLLVGRGRDNEYFAASGQEAFAGFCEEFFYLHPETAAALSPSRGLLLRGVWPREIEVLWFPVSGGGGGGGQGEKEEEERLPSFYSCWMEKEIREQAETIARPPFYFENLLSPAAPASAYHFFGCGSSYHAGLLGRLYMQKIAQATASVASYAAETADLPGAYGGAGWVHVALSQSGETHDTVLAAAALKKISRFSPSAAVVPLVNREPCSLSVACGVGSPGAVLACGTERGVAATKSFTSQLACLWNLAVCRRDGSKRYRVPEGLDREIGRLVDTDLSEDVDLVRGFEHVLFLGKGEMYPVALEAALKLKEVAYVHAEGMYASEIKHGPLALLDEKTLCIFLIGAGDQATVRDNISQIRARDGHVLCAGASTVVMPEEVGGRCLLPSSHEWNAEELLLAGPVLVSVYCQMLAMGIGLAKGNDVDRPRALAKSVTV